MLRSARDFPKESSLETKGKWQKINVVKKNLSFGQQSFGELIAEKCKLCVSTYFHINIFKHCGCGDIHLWLSFEFSCAKRLSSLTRQKSPVSFQLFYVMQRIKENVSANRLMAKQDFSLTSHLTKDSSSHPSPKVSLLQSLFQLTSPFWKVSLIPVCRHYTMYWSSVQLSHLAGTSVSVFLLRLTVFTSADIAASQTSSGMLLAFLLLNLNSNKSSVRSCCFNWEWGPIRWRR